MDATSEGHLADPVDGEAGTDQPVDAKNQQTVTSSSEVRYDILVDFEYLSRLCLNCKM